MIEELNTFSYEEERKCEEELKCIDLDRPGVKVFYLGITGCVISCVIATPMVAVSMFVVGVAGIIHSSCSEVDNKKYN